MGKRSAFVQELKRIIEDDSHGYDQAHRWGPDYDCSSLIIHCLHAAGYDVQEGSGYTGTLYAIAKRIGCEIYVFDGNVNDMNEPGFVWNVDQHVEGVINAKLWGGAHINEKGTVTGGKQGDQKGNEISYCNPYHLAAYPNDWDYYAALPDEAEAPSPKKPVQPDKVRVHTTAHDWVEIDGKLDGFGCNYADIKADGWPVVPKGGKASDGDDFAGDLGTPIKKLSIG